MKMNEIMEFLNNISKQQGVYGRVYKKLITIQENDKDLYNEITKELEAQNFSHYDIFLYDDLLDIVYKHLKVGNV